MLRRIKEKFWNMKFRRKLLFSHTMVCVIPIVILGFFCYQQVLHLMMEREKESLSQSMKQAEQTVMQNWSLTEILLLICPCTPRYRII